MLLNFDDLMRTGVFSHPRAHFLFNIEHEASFLMLATGYSYYSTIRADVA